MIGLNKRTFYEKDNLSDGSEKGFTLLEVLVGLVLLAIALATVLRVTRERTETLSSLRARIFADWVAQNKLAELQMNPGAIASTDGESYQAGQLFRWKVAAGEVSLFSKATPVVIKVTDAAHQSLVTRQQWIFPAVQIESERAAENPAVSQPAATPPTEAAKP